MDDDDDGGSSPSDDGEDEDASCTTTTKTVAAEKTPLSRLRKLTPLYPNDNDDDDDDDDDVVDRPRPIFEGWKGRAENGWPVDRRAIICDRKCGESVLRGSDIFVRGVSVSDFGLEEGEEVAVYADVTDVKAKGKAVSRGTLLERYGGTAVFLGLGTSARNRADMFGSSSTTDGVGIRMIRRAGHDLPPLNGLLTGKMMLQNIPSMMVGICLGAKRGESILDMCSCPGGKAPARR